MSQLTPEEVAAGKRAIYEKIPVRRRKFIDKMGYDNWDPFMEPADPIDIRKDRTGRTAQQLVTEFMAFSGKGGQADYMQTVQELAVILGDAALTDVDKKYAAFADAFEKQYVSQGYQVNRTIEETLNLGWGLLAMLPRNELKRIRDDMLDRYLHDNTIEESALPGGDD